MSDGGPAPKLNSCNCCAAGPSLSAISNRPGLTALSYRLGTYGSFLQRLFDDIGSVTIPDGPNQGAQPLAALTTRALDDPSIALLDAWAVVADVLTFYQERIANEGYLRTATERRSVLELARAIGYELSPGVAASAYLQFTVEEIIGAAATPTAPGARAQSAAGPGSSAFNSGIVSVPKGSQVQSIPAPGQLPQTFETAADFQARVEWNKINPRLTRHPDLALYGGKLYLLGTSASFVPGTFVLLPGSGVYLLDPQTKFISSPFTLVPAVEVKQLYFQGTNTNLKAGDRLLLVGAANQVLKTHSFVVLAVDADSDAKRTRVTFDPSPSLPTFAPVSLPVEVLQQGKVPFNHTQVRAHILEKSISESDLRAFLKMNGWDASELAALVNNPAAPVLERRGAFALRNSAAFFGHNAPKWKSLPDPKKVQRDDPYPVNWDAANNNEGQYIWTNSQGTDYAQADAYLERSFPQIVDNSWALLESHGLPATAYRITGTVEKSLADYSLSGKATGLKLMAHESSKGRGFGSPSAVSWASHRLDVFTISLDGRLYHMWWQDSPWGGPEDLGGDNLVNTPSAVSWAANRLDVFAHGSNGVLYHKWWDGDSWGGPESLGGGIFVNSPSGVAWAANRLDVFSIGANGNLYHKWWDGSSWGGPENLGGGNLVNSPSVVSWAANRLDVFAYGSDGNLYHKWWDGSSWGGPENLGGGNLVNSPSVVSWAANRLDIFSVGRDGSMYHKWWNGSSWSGMQNLGGSNLVNSPSAVSWAANRLDIFALNTSGDLYHKWWGGSFWGAWDNLGGSGNMIMSPSAVSWSANRLDIFVTGSVGHWMHKYWAPGWGGPEDLGDGGAAPYLVRRTSAFFQSEQLALADWPVEDNIPAGATELMLNNMVLGLTPGRPVALSGMRADASGVTGNELLVLDDIVHSGGFTVLKFQKGLQHGYLRSSVVINANVTLATHGATVSEILGSGDASQTRQSFALKRPPLTYVSAPTPSGIASTLEVRVNDQLWQEAPTFYGLGVKNEEYVVRLADDGTPALTFGEPAARLKTGQQNVRATYRTGIGLAGNVGAGSLSMLQSRPPGLRGVTNPLAANGGADPQDLPHARVNAPLAVLTLERIVSLDDYENFVRAFAGIGKAQAVVVWSGETRLVHVTVAGANGNAVEVGSPLYQTLLQAIQLAHDPVQNVIVAPYQPLIFNIAAAVLIDKPRYEPVTVLSEVADALAAAFSFENRSFAQAVTAAEVVTMIQSVPGVIATDLNQLYMSSDPTGPSQIEALAFLPASPAGWQGNAIQPAQLLLLNPLGAKLTEMTA